MSEVFRKFCAALEPTLAKVLADFPRPLQLAKQRASALFSYSLKRHTWTNHFANATREQVLNEPQTVELMYEDFCRIDLAPEAAWVTQCDPDLVASIVADFKDKLKKARCSLEEWAQWIEAVLDQASRCC